MIVNQQIYRLVIESETSRWSLNISKKYIQHFLYGLIHFHVSFFHHMISLLRKQTPPKQSVGQAEVPPNLQGGAQYYN